MLRVVRSLSLLWTVLFLPSMALGGAVDNSTNTGPNYLRHLAPNATAISAESMVFNPAGTTRLDNGLYVNLSTQTMLLQHAHSSLGNTYKATDTIKSIPSAYVVYSYEDFALFYGLHLVGGGGGVHYKRGSASLGRDYDLKLAAAHIANTLGAAYAPAQWLSFSMSGRFIYALNQIKTEQISTGFVIADYADHATGFGTIFGLNIMPGENLVLSVRYDTGVMLNYETTVSEGPLGNGIGLVGARHRRDLPAFLALGAQYSLLEKWRLLWSLNYFFHRQADWGGLEKLHDDGWESAVGAEVDVSDRLVLSGGLLYGSPGPRKNGYVSESPSLDNVSFGLGGFYRITERFRIEGSFTGSFGFDTQGINATTGALVDMTTKNVWVWSLALQYHFLKS